METRNYHADQSLNQWHFMFNAIYGIRNSERDAVKLFSHLVEVGGGFAKIVRKGSSPRDVASFLGKLFAWYSALSTRLGFRDLESIAWQKYPGICPYCGETPCRCRLDLATKVLPTARLRQLQQENRHLRPQSLSAWQRMFLDIYGTPTGLLVNPASGLSTTKSQLLTAVSRLTEELGELAEAIRLEHVYPIALPSELADVFAWIMAVANTLPAHLEDPSFSLELALWSQYPGYCAYCSKLQCICPNDRVRPSLVASAGTESEHLPDELTGLFRKEQFERSLAEEVSRSTEQFPLSLIIVDLDDFKKVNDTWGHSFGDTVLSEAAKVVKRVASYHSGIAFRWGGEEFTLLLPNRSDVEGFAVAERLRNEIKLITFTAPDRSMHRQACSCGIATISSSRGGSVASITRDVFNAADAALYRAKHLGKDRTIAAVGEEIQPPLD
jgi:diguanylate cyclase (GGDEF)-like protein